MNYWQERGAFPIRVYFAGSLDATTAAEARRVVDELASERPPELAIDISRVEFLDSSGVAVLVSLFKRVRSTGGKVKVVGVTAQPLAVLRLLGIDRLLCDRNQPHRQC